MNKKCSLIYEHWRPDTNECFYVGASWVGAGRSENFSPRNSNYRDVVEFLKNLGLKPYCKIIWQSLEDCSVGTYEKMRISYQRALIGNRLTNIMNGGEGFSLSPEKNREIQIKVQNLPEVNAKRSASLKKANAKEEVRARRSAAASAAHSRPGQKEKRTARESNPELREKRISSAKLGGLKAAQRTKEQKRLSGIKAAETRRLRKINHIMEQNNVN